MTATELSFLCNKNFNTSLPILPLQEEIKRFDNASEVLETRIFSLLPTVTGLKFQRAGSNCCNYFTPTQPCREDRARARFDKGVVTGCGSCSSHREPLGKGAIMDVHFTSGFSFIYFTLRLHTVARRKDLKLLQKSDQMLTWSSFSLTSI